MAKKLSPVVIASKTAAKKLVTQEDRKRPVVAINEEGKLVVCSRRTARKHGWEVQEVMYARTKKVGINEAGKLVVSKEKPASKKTPQRRATDSMDVVMVSRTELEKVKDTVDKRVEKLLDKS